MMTWAFASRPGGRAWRGAASAMLLFALSACVDRVAPPDGAGIRAPVTITATLTAAQQALVAGMSVEVTGPGITTPITATLTVSGATVNGSVSVPVGASRTFTVHAFDAKGTETYSGNATAAVVAGTNPPLTVRLAALEGSVAIDVTVGTYGVTLSPPTASVAVDGDVTLTANVTASGQAVAGALTWGVVNPTLVTLSVAPDGRSATVRGKLAGTTRVIASYEGVAAASTITVTGSPGGAVALTSVSAGATHVCGLTADGRAWCWGSNVGGRLGAGTQSNTSGPVQVPGLTFASISAGGGHTCGVSTAGVGYCWGDNLNGQIGDGTKSTRSTPYAIPGLTFKALVAGSGSTCGLTTDGLAYCWGLNDKGQLGDGTTTSHIVPAPVSFGRHYGAITMGDAHACAIRATTEPNGALVDCWGDDSRNQLGGSTTSPLVPGVASASVRFSTISAGAQHTCGITADVVPATSYCWGSNLSGQIGNTNATGNAMFTPINGPYLFIEAGGNNACAIKANTNTNCWGFNLYGEVGDNSTSSISGPVTALGPPFTTLSVGGGFTCALSAAGTAFCWGRNEWGQLGTGDLVERHAPAAVVWP